jgi:V8-like Glu-specific endopeptidase
MWILSPLMMALAYAAPLGIYGEDNRHDVYTSTNPLHKRLAHSTAALIDLENLSDHGHQIDISATLFGNMYRLCPQEKFRFQPTAANCSGSLIAPDIIMTAGHCYDLPDQVCKNFAWVFDYKTVKERQSTVSVSPESVYRCKKVLLREESFTTGIDHALIKLDRPVTGRSPLKLRASGNIKPQEKVVLIGHPRGLPTKIADGAYVLEVHPKHFVSNVDAYTVNSGSAVFNAESGEIEGILSAGPMDFEMINGCTSSRVLSMEEGAETVVKIDIVREFLRKIKH